MSAASEPGRADRPQLRVVRLDPAATLPRYARDGDAGMDLASLAAVELAPGERAGVRTGLAVAVPPGWVGLVHPRSGLALRRGLTVINTPGTIDSGYRGELVVPMVNLGEDVVAIAPGDRVAQLVLQRVGAAEVLEVAAFDDPQLDGTERGTGGFGSTGLTGVTTTD